MRKERRALPSMHKLYQFVPFSTKKNTCFAKGVFFVNAAAILCGDQGGQAGGKWRKRWNRGVTQELCVRMAKRGFITRLAEM
jgi:hypothetical protein